MYGKVTRLSKRITKFQELQGAEISAFPQWVDPVLQEIACDQIVYSSDPARHIDLSVVERDFGETSAGSGYRIHLRLKAAWNSGSYQGNSSNSAIAKAIGANPGALSSFMSRSFPAATKPKHQFTHINTDHLQQAAKLFDVSYQWLLDGRKFSMGPDREVTRIQPSFMVPYVAQAQAIYQIFHGGRDEFADDDQGLLHGFSLPSLDGKEIEPWIDLVMCAIGKRSAVIERYVQGEAEKPGAVSDDAERGLRHRRASLILQYWLQILPLMPDYMPLLLRIRREREDRKKATSFILTLTFDEVRDVLMGLEMAQKEAKAAVGMELAGHFGDLMHRCLVGTLPVHAPRFRSQGRLPELVKLSSKIASQAFPSPQPPLAKPRAKRSEKTKRSLAIRDQQTNDLPKSAL